MNRYVMGVTGRLLIVTTLVLGMPLQPASAGLVETDRAVPSSQSSPDRDRIQAFLAREDVRARLQGWGIDAEAAKARVAALTDEEVGQIAGRLDELPAGAGTTMRTGRVGQAGPEPVEAACCATDGSATMAHRARR